MVLASVSASDRVSAQSQPVEWRAREELRIGGIDGPAALTFVHDLAVADSLVFVAQSQERLIRVFHRDGMLLGSFGRAGQGPGEYRRIDYLGWRRGRLVVVDEAQMRITELEADGTVQRTRRIPAIPSRPPLVWSGRTYAAAGGKIVISGTTSYRDSHRLEAFPVVLAGFDGAILDTLPSIYHRGWQRVIEGVVFMAPIHHGTRKSMSQDGRYFAVADGSEEEVVVRVYDVLDGSLERVSLPLPARPVPSSYSDDIAERYRENMRLTAIGGMPLARFKRELGLPENAVGVEFVQVMNNGTVWVSEPSFGAETRTWHVADPTTGTRWIVRAPGDVVVMAQGDSDREVWGRAMDEYLVHYVVRLTLEPAEGP